jgi:hypothetical protein
MSAAPLLLRPQPGRYRSSGSHKPIYRDIWKPATSIKIHLALIVLCALLLYLFTSAVALILSGVLIGTPLLALGIVEARRDPLWLNPLSVFLLFLGIQLGPAAVYAGISLLSEDSLRFPLFRIPAHDLVIGYLISLIGTFAMHLGLRSFRPVHIHVSGSISWKPHWIFVLYAVGIAAIYRPSAFLFLGVFGGMLQLGCMAVLLAYAFSNGSMRTLATRLLFAAGVAIYVLAAFFGDNSSKSYTMLAFLPAIVLVTGRPKYYKWVPVAAVLLLVLYLGVVAPAVNTSRSIQKDDSYEKIVLGLKSSSPFYTDEPFIMSLENQFQGLMGRLFEVPQVCGFMVGEVGRSGLQVGNTMKTFYYAFIPRIVWPEKPPVSRGAWFSTYLGMAAREAEATTSTGMTAIGEWYWNFGLLGVVVGMFLTGALLSGLWRLAGSNPIHRPANMVLYVALIINVLNLPDATSPIVSNAASYLLFGTLIYLRKFEQRVATPAKSVMMRPLPMNSRF